MVYTIFDKRSNLYQVCSREHFVHVMNNLSFRYYIGFRIYKHDLHVCIGEILHFD